MTRLSSNDVQKVLDTLGLNIAIQIFDQPTSTAQEAADAIGTELGSIVKSLCFTINGKPIVVLVAGDNKVDSKKLAAIFHVGKKKVRFADPETTINATGYEPGGVPPVGHATNLPVLIDESLNRFETVYAAAGSPYSIFPIQYKTLLAITDGQPHDLAR